MISISKELKESLYSVISLQPSFCGNEDPRLGYIPFLMEIWNLKEMPSEDHRYANAFGDIKQHTVNNDDWNFYELFIERLKLLESDEHFQKFIELVLHPKYRKDTDEIIRFVLLIDPYLEKEGYKLSLTEYEEKSGLPIYAIYLKEEVENLPVNIKKNDIVFFVVKNPKGRSYYVNSHDEPKVKPSFVLVFNDGWNDYDIMTEFSLFYYSEEGEKYSIGKTKIQSNDSENTSVVISNKFKILGDDFCSLGQEYSFYLNLKRVLKEDFESVLFALKDAAFFPEIQEKFERGYNFKVSLLREDEAERLLRVAKYEIYKYDLSNLYKFRYSFKPIFSEDNIEIDFSFDSNEELPNRIYAIIGKNGTGKTQLISSLPIKIAQKDDDSFLPRTPMFSKVIAVSYSIFDKFDIPKKTASFNYLYCGLRNEKGEEHTERGLILRFHNAWKRIEEIGRINQWRKILSNFIEEEILNSFIVINPDSTSRKNFYTVSIHGFNNVKNQLSSGQSIILYIITQITANIRYDSLLLYDEPETHLHPNAITELMNTIYELVNEFQSYCIIATHSPLIIRELHSKNVYVMERNGNSASVNRIGLESFGENLTTLTDEVFGNKNIPKQYKKIIQELVNQGKSFDEIISLLEFDDFPISLNTHIFIKTLYKKNEKS